MSFHVDDLVQLIEAVRTLPLPGVHLPAGSSGTVVDVHGGSGELYTVRFDDQVHRIEGHMLKLKGKSGMPSPGDPPSRPPKP